MAFIRSRVNTTRSSRYDVRYRANGRGVVQDVPLLRRRQGLPEEGGGRRARRPRHRPHRWRAPVLGGYAENWIEHRLVKGRPLSPATRQGYRALLRRHLGPAFGGMKLRQITPERIRQWQTELRGLLAGRSGEGLPRSCAPS